MANYSIKDLEKLSGIKAHTLRIWEKRHDLLKPKRTDTNIRYYDDDQLKKIISVSILNEQGLKISRIASMTHEEIEESVKGISANSRSDKYYIDQLILAMIDLDELMFQNILQEITMKVGFEDLVTKVLYSFLDQIGVLWLTGNIIPAHEHFVSNLMRQKILVAIDNIQTPVDNDVPRVLMFLPEKEMHEIGHLFHYYLVKKAGFRVVYLGQCVPKEDVIESIKHINPTYLITGMTTPQFKDGGKKFLKECLSQESVEKVIASGPAFGVKTLNTPGFLYAESATKFRDLITGLKISV